MSSTAAGPTPSTIRFGDLHIAYDDRVLRPRLWTAAQAAWAAIVLETAPPGPVLELCSGAGHIGLLAVRDTDRRLVTVDADPAACSFTRRNAVAAGLGDRVEVRHARLEDALAPDEEFPVIVADPPWVPTEQVSQYTADPPFAIDGGSHGLAVALRCVDLARRHLAPGGTMLLQLGSPEQVVRILPRVAAASLEVAEARRPDPTGVVVSVQRARTA
jgi:release factor glutamine methyltransferase